MTNDIHTPPLPPVSAAIDEQNHFGCQYLEQEKYADAEICFRQALALGDDSFDLYRNLGDTLLGQRNPNAAISYYEKALSWNPDSAGIYGRMGIAYRAANRYQEAVTHLRKALAIEPDLPAFQLSLASLLILLGDLAEGMRLAENRFKLQPEWWPLVQKFSAKPMWNGNYADGKTLLVWAEQGMGDNVMAMRYIPLLKEKGVGTVIIYCHEVFQKIALTMTNLVINTNSDPSTDLFDFHCSMLSLPYLFKTTLETIPCNIPYLQSDDTVRKKWAQQVQKFQGLKVGIAWAGFKNTAGNEFRNIALQRFAPLMKIHGVQYLSLQKSEESEQLQSCNWPILDWMDASHDLIDTAAFIDNLDLIISADTVIVHLAGALGKPVWLLNRFEGDSRWLIDREDSPWYPSMRIFRQPVIDDWGSVIENVADELGKLVQTHHHSQAMPLQQWVRASNAADRSLGINKASAVSAPFERLLRFFLRR